MSDCREGKGMECVWVRWESRPVGFEEREVSGSEGEGREEGRKAELDQLTSRRVGCYETLPLFGKVCFFRILRSKGETEGYAAHPS